MRLSEHILSGMSRPCVSLANVADMHGPYGLMLAHTRVHLQVPELSYRPLRCQLHIESAFGSTLDGRVAQRSLSPSRKWSNVG